MFGRFALVALAALSVSGCVFDLSSDDPKPKAKVASDCPPRDEANWARMQAFLDANKAKEGVKVTESGLQYRVLQQGKGTRNPTWASMVTVNYRGTLIDGTMFDENKAVEEYMATHKKMEESYVTTKALQEESRLSWATLYSSV
jgi:hypothetical protein